MVKAPAPTNRRVLMSCFGSGGDLFPFISVAEQLRSDGHEVTFACPRTLGLYLRALGFASVALGDGDEARVLRDDSMFNTRRGGWTSWEQTWDRYVGPVLVESHDTMARTLADHRPDLIITNTFAAAARIAALQAGVTHVALSMYPQYDETLAPTGGASLAEFAPAYRATASALAGHDLIDTYGERLVLWGVDRSGPIMHDPALLGASTMSRPVEITGFPDWESPSLGSADELIAALDWITSSTDPTVIVTQGSFIGWRGMASWQESAQATALIGVRAVLVGARGRWADETLANRSDIIATGYLPLSTVTPLADGGIHHGGLGTTFAFLRSGTPAVVRPHAYDQPFNANLVAQAGAGLDAGPQCTPATLANQLATILDGELTPACHHIRDQLIPARQAAARLASRISQAALAASSPNQTPTLSPSILRPQKRV